MFYMMAFTGALLAMVGLIVSRVAPTIRSASEVAAVGGSLSAAGMFIVAVGILMWLMKAREMSDQVKLGLLVAFGLIVGFGL